MTITHCVLAHVSAHGRPGTPVSQRVQISESNGGNSTMSVL